MAFFGIAKCCNPDQADTRPCCCCGRASYRCAECAPVDGRPNLTVQAEPKDWLDKEMCNGALLGFVRDRPAYDRVLVPWFECTCGNNFDIIEASLTHPAHHFDIIDSSLT